MRTRRRERGQRELEGRRRTGGEGSNWKFDSASWRGLPSDVKCYRYILANLLRRFCGVITCSCSSFIWVLSNISLASFKFPHEDIYNHVLFPI